MAFKRHRKWTQHELAIVNRAVIEGRRPRDIEPMLPGRTRQQVQNACSAARRRLRGETVTTEERRRKGKADREARVEHGVCCVCGGLLDDDGTLTKCSECRHDRGELFMQEQSPHVKNECDMLPWIYSRQQGNLATYLPKSSRRVIDLFAGSGRFSRAANRRGFKVVYNDVHPLLSAYTTAVRERMHAEINLATTDMAMDVRDFRSHYRAVYDDPSDVLEAAATARLAAFNAPRGCHLDETEIVKFAPLVCADAARDWRGMDVSSLDFADAIAEHDRPSTTFFVDPPYPGTSFYEHNLSWRRFGTLLDSLRGARGNVLMVLPTQRRTVKKVAEKGFHMYLRLIKTPLFKGRDLVVSSKPIKDNNFLETFRPERFGIGNRDAVDDAVDHVIEKVLENGSPMTRRQLEHALDASPSSVFGALSRARAEGRIARVGRGHYFVSDVEESA